MAELSAYLQKIERTIETIEANEALKLHEAGDCCFVDLRDGLELLQYGEIPGAEHCPRGSLEFRIPTDSKWHRPFFSQYSRFVFYCSHGQRSILGTRTAMEMGLKNVCHIRGGMIAWVRAGGAVNKAA